MIVVGLSHRNAPLEVRERLAIAPKAMGPTLERFRQGSHVGEVALLSTCNRVEIYATPTDGADNAALEADLLRTLTDIGGRKVAPHLVCRRGQHALRHILRVASSLDSLVVGEPQILGQLKKAFRTAEELGSSGPALSAVMKAALHCAKRVRTETAIGAGQVSVPSVAVDLASQIFEDLSGQRALLVGAGEMAEAAAKLLARAGAEIMVINRSPQRAEKLANVVGGRPVFWDNLEDALVSADIVIASTSSSKYVLTYRMLKGLRRKRRGRSLFLIDIAVPRDVDPKANRLENVYLYDVDDLSHVVAQSLEGRRAEAEQAESIILQEAGGYQQRRAQQAVKPVVVALRERTRQTLIRELDKSFKGRLKHLSDDDRHALGVMLDAAVNKLLHAPTKHLKKLAETQQAGEAAAMMTRLFELDTEPLAACSLPPKEVEAARDNEGRDNESSEAESEGERVAVRH